MPHTFCNMPHSITSIKEEPLVTHRNVSSNSNSMPDLDDDIFEDAPEFPATDVSSGSLHHHENTNSLIL